MSLYTKYPEARAETVFPATSEPGQLASTLNEGLSMCMFSGRPQKWWSSVPSPTWNKIIHKYKLNGVGFRLVLAVFTARQHK